MAAGFLSAPGTEYGPCNECHHTDCAQMRGTADSICPHCGESIGYDRRFFELECDQRVALGAQYVHESCALSKQPFMPGDIVQLNPLSPDVPRWMYGRVRGCHTYRVQGFSETQWSVDLDKVDIHEHSGEYEVVNVQAYMVPAFDCKKIE